MRGNGDAHALSAQAGGATRSGRSRARRCACSASAAASAGMHVPWPAPGGELQTTPAGSRLAWESSSQHPLGRSSRCTCAHVIHRLCVSGCPRPRRPIEHHLVAPARRRSEQSGAAPAGAFAHTPALGSSSPRLPPRGPAESPTRKARTHGRSERWILCSARPWT